MEKENYQLKLVKHHVGTELEAKVYEGYGYTIKITKIFDVGDTLIAKPHSGKAPELDYIEMSNQIMITPSPVLNMLPEDIDDFCQLLQNAKLCAGEIIERADEMIRWKDWDTKKH